MFAVIAYMMSTSDQGPMQMVGMLLFLMVVGAALITYDACVSVIKRIFRKRT